MNLETIMIYENDPVTQDHILYDGIYKNCPEYANL
jgi:hypothetical protein